MRALGVVLLAAAAVAGTIGALWLALALLGAEWDYCRRGGDCIAGEIIGGAILATSALLAWTGVRLARTR